MTSPMTLNSKAIHVKNTWGSRCDHTLYMSSVENQTFPAVGLNVREGRDYLWNKTRAAFEYIYEHNFTKKFDWFIKADDDTYVIVENLKYFLRDKNSSELVYYGHNFKVHITNGYMSGGAGYVLSRSATEKLVTYGLQSCPRNYMHEDLALGRCLQSLGVQAGDSRDALGRHRFLPFPISDMMNENRMPNWYFNYVKYKVHKVG